MSTLRGREVFMESLVAHGASAIFGNPGTTENPLLDSLIDYPQLPYYVALHESVAMCAATFHAQATGRLSVVNVHVAPGLGNAIGMMYGALKACAPVLVTAGQQDTRMRLREPLLSHDLVAMARPVCKWAGEPQSADEVAPMVAEAIRIAMTPPMGPVFLSMPVNVFAAETGNTTVTAAVPARTPPADDEDIEQLTALLARSSQPAILAGDDVTTFGGFDALIRIAERCNARVYVEGLRTHVNFPNKHSCYGGRIPFEASTISAMLAPHDLVLMIGGPFFEEIWYDDEPSIRHDKPLVRIEQSPERTRLNFTPQLTIVADIGATLEKLANRLPERSSPAAAAHADPTEYRGWNSTPMSPFRAMHELAAALPADTVVVDESITAYPDVAAAFDFSAPHTYYAGRGGGIGQGLAGAIGVQVAHPHRTVVAISGDGSAMYSIQALWSAAHHALPVLFVILANREYRVLKHNLDIYRARFEPGTNRPYPHMDLDGPVLDFVQAAAAQGVRGMRIEQPDAIGTAVAEALASKQPAVIEIVVSGKR